MAWWETSSFRFVNGVLHLGAGAYGRSMASNFNLRPIPAEILV